MKSDEDLPPHLRRPAAQHPLTAELPLEEERQDRPPQPEQSPSQPGPFLRRPSHGGDKDR